MNESSVDSRRGRSTLVFVLAIALLAGAVAYYWYVATQGGRGSAGDSVAEAVVADFFKSLAALDVQETELAAGLLEKAVQAEPGEPALWANLAVAQLRLNDMEGARTSLAEARRLDGGSRELDLLQAELLEYSGQIDQAIEQLRAIHQQWPENIAVTYTLLTLLGQLRSDEADAERLTLLADILQRAPNNVQARCELARLAATLQRSEELRPALDNLLSGMDRWPEAAQKQLTEADRAARDGDFRQAALSLAFFENVLRPEPQYRQSSAQLGLKDASAIGTPLRDFLKLKLPAIEAAEADVAMTFDLQEPASGDQRADLVLALVQSEERRPSLLSLAGDSLQVGDSALPFPGSATEALASSIAGADLNFDFQQDLILVGADGCRIFLLQPDDGAFVLHPAAADELAQAWRSVWAVDVEADGDLDLLLSDHQSALRWVRNNGDMTFTVMRNFIDAVAVRQVLTIDFDQDGDVDLVTLDAQGTLAVWSNERGGRYAAVETALTEPRIRLASGDVDRDGRFDLVSLLPSGELRAAAWNAEGTWSESPLTSWSPAASLAEASAGDVFLAVGDVDNNGAVDLIASQPHETAVWLQQDGGGWTQLAGPPALRTTSMADMDNDGRLDLVGLTDAGGPRLAINQSKAGYGWHVMQPKASTMAGDRRINSFGVGGRIEVRAGNLVQAAAIQSPNVHFGLGTHGQADVARIVWPNGTVQAEFDLPARATQVAAQRLSTSCPWVFAFDGSEFRFVTDFLWRSPLGLRINSQATAGVMQTEDWIKIGGDELAAADGRYQVRITAELWETHFFDHVALLAVDHPADVQVLVDERFVPNAAPENRIIVATPAQPLHNVVDHHGDPLDQVLQASDGVYADRFALGQYQGLAEEHWVEFEVPAQVSADRNVLIVGNGWIYPTDSSINVAIDQAGAGPLFGLVLEQQDAGGQWRVLRDNLGFPAGKNKDAVLALPAGSLSASRRFRLRTNMEVYWDSLGWSYEVTDVEPQTVRRPLQLAELRQRGYSTMLPPDRRRPDTPIYEVEATRQRWLDLEGYCTRFGDVLELLQSVDDRYVIMSAGDELVFEFDAGDGVPGGWRRDFVLVGDGWVKDGNLNTAFSRWVRPLPAHDLSQYSGPLVPLQQDPVYLRHAEDWRVYHTRYVAPRTFQRGLWPPPGQIHGEP